MKAKKNRASLLLIIILFFGISAGLYLLLRKDSGRNVLSSRMITKKSPYFVPLKVNGYSSADIPYFKVNIGNKTITAKIDLGYEGDISLTSNILNEIEKKNFITRKPSYGLGGRTYQSNIYRIEKIDIENMSFPPVRAEEMNPEFENDIQLRKMERIPEIDFGRVGWCLFYNFNLLIDCEHSNLALCDSIETLQRKGYPVESFTEVPLLLDRGFIEFEALTEAGLLRCVLDTGSTWNMLNKDLANSRNDHMIFTPENVNQYPVLNPKNENLLIFDSKNICDVNTFSIGNKEFGPITFNRIKTPMAIDAIIGMEFFKTTLIFIDFSNRKLYFYEYPEKLHSVLDKKTG